MNIDHPVIVGGAALGVVQLAEMIPTDPDTISIICKTMVQVFIGIITIVKLLRKDKKE